MHARDRIHDAVRAALERAGWSITDDPYRIEHVGTSVYCDLAAERRDDSGATQLISVEIKSFLGHSALHDLYVAVGQYVVYRRFLEVTEPDRTLHLPRRG